MGPIFLLPNLTNLPFLIFQCHFLRADWLILWKIVDKRFFCLHHCLSQVYSLTNARWGMQQTKTNNWRNSKLPNFQPKFSVLPILLHRPNSNVGHDKETTTTFRQTYDHNTSHKNRKVQGTVPKNSLWNSSRRNTLHEEPSHSPCFPNRFTGLPVRFRFKKKACMKAGTHLSVSCTLRKEAQILFIRFPLMCRAVEFRNSLRKRFDEHLSSMIFQHLWQNPTVSSRQSCIKYRVASIFLLCPVDLLGVDAGMQTFIVIQRNLSLELNMLASTAAAACSKRMKPGVLPADYLLPCLEYRLITRNHIPDFSLCLLSSNSQPYGLFWFHQTTLVPGNCADGLAMRALKGCQFLTYANQPIPNFCESQWHHAPQNDVNQKVDQI